MSTTDVLAALINRDQLIRFSCSDIASIAGYHPYASITELVEKYMYQDLDLLRQIDCRNLGIEFISSEEEVDGIVRKLSVEHQEKFQMIQRTVSDATTLQSQYQAQDLLKTVQELVMSKELRESVSKEELLLLEREFEGKVKKQYGIFSEDSALDRYEEIMGFKVVERNDCVNIMDILPLEIDLTSSDDVNANSSTIVTKSSVSTSTSSGSSQPRDLASVLMSSSSKQRLASSLDKDTTTSKKRKKLSPKPAFCLIGKVDGISYQLDTASDDASQWIPNKVVVEVKSRVFCVRDPPPLYEQIQLVSYMIMLNCKQGDLVQAVRSPANEITTTVSTSETLDVNGAASITIETRIQSSTSSSSSSNPKDFLISRVTLNAAPYYHQFHWETVIVPRLHVFRDALMVLRKNDDLRSCYLLATDDAKIAMIHHLCPYLGT